jgi:hypothetical protein
VYWSPALTEAKASPPETATGVLLPILLPFPSSPLGFTPQQYAAPLAVTAQV